MFEQVGALARTLLYEGYLLYPYRASALKNRHRFMLGTLYPRGFADGQAEGDRCALQAEVLVRGGADAVVEARVRFLHLAEPDAVEHEVDAPPHPLAALLRRPRTTAFEVGVAAGRGGLELRAESVEPAVVKLTARVWNATPFAPVPGDDRAARRDAALRDAFASTHLLVGVRGGELVSLMDPPEALRAAAARCRNDGVWPVLVGDPAARDTILAAPIILEDYPRVAPESPGDFFDATEIDELLTLRTLTLTEDEKRALRAGGAQARALLERTEGLDAEARRRLHGATRTRLPAGARAPALRPGARVRLQPRRGGDVLDLALAGRAATVVAVEEDYEGRVHVAVTVDDDPGRDLGAEGRPGHRFFFPPDEIELLP